VKSPSHARRPTVAWRWDSVRFASKSIEEVCEVNKQVLFQMYWSGDRDTMIQRLARAKAAGVKGIILTLDWSFANGRDWEVPGFPRRSTSSRRSS